MVILKHIYLTVKWDIPVLELPSQHFIQIKPSNVAQPKCLSNMIDEKIYKKYFS